MGSVSALMLTTAQTRALVLERDHYELPKHTLDQWIASGLVTPSRRGTNVRGQGHLLSMADIARLRLIVRLHRGTPEPSRRTVRVDERFKNRVSVLRLRVLMAALDADPRLRDELTKPDTTATIVVSRNRYTARIVRPGARDVEIPSGQLRLELRDVVEGNEATAKKLIA